MIILGAFYNLAAHAKGRPGTRYRDNALSTAHFCSMKITEDVRKYPAEQAISEEEALQSGMAEKSKEFVQRAAEVYQPA